MLHNHQMRFEQERGGATHHLDERKPEADVGHKHAIHHIDLEAIGAAFRRLNLLSQFEEIGSQDGWANLDCGHTALLLLHSCAVA
jgi:hypothetical protein